MQLFKRHFVFFLVLAWIAAADNIPCVPTDDFGTEVTDSNGRHYDLSPLRRRPPKKEWVAKDLTEKSDYRYVVNVCDRIYSDSQASDTHAAVWQVKVAQEDQVFECGDATTAKITLMEAGALRLTYNEGGLCHRAGVNRNTVISLVCKRHVPMDNGPALIGEDNCTYIFEWLTPAACPLDDAHRGMGFWGTLFLILFLIFVGYIFCGVIYRYFVLQKSGLETIPNLPMWTWLATSVTSCCHQCFAKISSRCGSGWGRPVNGYRGLRVDDVSEESLIAEEEDDRLLEP